MPRAPIITPDAVARAATELLAQGRPVTNAAVLDLVGGGSMSTLVPLLRAWRKDQKERVTREEVEVPETVMEQVRDLATRIWRDATEEAQTATDALRREMRDLRLEADQQQSELVAHLGKVEAERDDAISQRDAQLALIKDLEGERERISADLITVRATVDGLREKCAFLEAAAAKAEERADRAEQRLVQILHDVKAEMKPPATAEGGPAGSGPVPPNGAS
jgi:chromosome segregation ATPase